MTITHAAVKLPGEQGLASEWNADHVISEPQQPRLTATLIVAASDSENTEQADYVCDGTADQAEINTAITALPLNGGKVVLLEGTYNISDWILTKNNVTIEGQGYGTILNGILVDSVIFSNTKDYVIIKDLKITGTQSGAGDTSAIKIEEGGWCRVIRVFSDFNGDYGFWIDGGVYNTLTDCTTEGAAFNGIFLTSTSRNIVHGCISYDVASGIKLRTDADRNVVSSCVALGSSISIIVDTADCDKNLIHGNMAEDGITDNGTNTLSADNIVA